MQIIGHRGASGDFPENTMIAFKEAIKQGATALELDVHQCKTGEVVIMHDGTVDRTTNGSGKISEMTLDELKALDAGKGQKIPTLQEVLDAFDGEITLYIEPKHFHAITWGKLIHEAVKDGKWEYEQLPFIGQNHPQLLALRYMEPKFSIAPSFLPIPQKDYIGTILPMAERLDAKEINLSHRIVTPGLVDQAHGEGILVNAWTVNKNRDMKRMYEADVDGLVTDHPGMAKNYVRHLEAGKGKAEKLEGMGRC
ncbi:MAG: glycerophosphodiester phosphodiesterase [Rickettsiales bacterium]